MTLAEHTKRIHPLVAVAAAAVTLFSLLGIAAITGLLPNSYGTAADPTRDAQANYQQAQDPGRNDEMAAGANRQARPVHQVKQGNAAVASNGAVQHSNAPTQPAPVAQKTPQNSPVGIGVGAVVGGVLGNQVGSGDGKTLATIIGAVGGGYIGNEIAKKNQ
jgi:uncharacterized protein YcfJ